MIFDIIVRTINTITIVFIIILVLLSLQIFSMDNKSYFHIRKVNPDFVHNPEHSFYAVHIKFGKTIPNELEWTNTNTSYKKFIKLNENEVICFEIERENNTTCQYGYFTNHGKVLIVTEESAHPMKFTAEFIQYEISLTPIDVEVLSKMKRRGKTIDDIFVYLDTIEMKNEILLEDKLKLYKINERLGQMVKENKNCN